MDGATVLVSPFTREFLCIGRQDRGRHSPTTVTLDEGRGECPECGQQVHPWHAEPAI